ncbi:MAG: YigZ family protein [Tenericutes bacterium]|nr:YigZ family protein [Mycoplasmatota bacterium]
MQTIKENFVDKYEIKQSKFITLLYKINSIDDINIYLQEVKNNYKDATHYCYAYKFNGSQKFSDDGEPGGTAGLPIVEVLNKKDINNVLCIVVRYFGGIKLGSGGLVRAYTKAVCNAIDKCQIIILDKGYLIRINLNYDEQKKYDYLFKDKIIKKEFNNQITYYIKISKDELEKINNINFEILENIYIEKPFN